MREDRHSTTIHMLNATICGHVIVILALVFNFMTPGSGAVWGVLAGLLAYVAAYAADSSDQDSDFCDWLKLACAAMTFISWVILLIRLAG